MSTQTKRVLHTCRDQMFIEVADSGEFRSLYFRDQIVQSRIMLKYPYRLILRYTQYMTAASLLVCSNPKRVLIIGLGAGALIHFFAHHFPQTYIDAVDYSEHIIKIARGYFNLPENDFIAVHCNDGLRFLRENNELKKYDLVFVDAFNDSGMAKNIYSNEFARMAKNSLEPNGVMVFNLWSGNAKAFDRVKKAIVNNCKNAIYIPVRKRENVVSLLFQTDIPWQHLSPAPHILKNFSHKYNLDFTEVSTAAKKNNLKLGERVQLWFH